MCIGQRAEICVQQVNFAILKIFEKGNFGNMPKVTTIHFWKCATFLFRRRKSLNLLMPLVSGVFSEIHFTLKFPSSFTEIQWENLISSTSSIR
jgi:hypothetical protein